MNNIKLLREQKGLNMKEASVELGIPYTTYVSYEKGQREPNSEMLIKIANHYNTTTDFVLGATDNQFPFSFTSPTITDETTTFPIIADVAAGYDKIAVEDWSGDTVEIPNSYLRGRVREEFFVLRVTGDSMYPMYQDGDKVLILKQSTLNNSGDVGVIIYDDELATLKKVEYVMGEDWMRLIPINPEFKPKLIEGEELERCRVIGIPKLLIREI